MRLRKRQQSDVAIVKNPNESDAILEALSLIRAGELIAREDVVVITPNWVKKMMPETGVVVGNESLGTLIRFIKDKNPKRIVVASGSGGDKTPDVMKESGFDTVLKAEGVEFIDLNHGPFLRVDLKHDRPNSTLLNNIFTEMTCLVSFTQLKTHEEATISGAIKNVALSWPPAEEHGFPKKSRGIHDRLHGFIRSMAEIIPIDISVVSANPAMVGTGPAKGIPRHTGIVLAGTDPFSVDTIAARLMGYKPQAIQYLYEGGNMGLGQIDVLRMNLHGLGLIEAEKEFSNAVYGNAISVDAD